MRNKLKKSRRRVLADRYRLDLLLKPRRDPRTGKMQPGFETVAKSVAEDQDRGQSLRETAARVVAICDGILPLSRDAVALKTLNIDAGAAINLADRLDAGAESGSAQPTMASALFMREQRLRTIGGLLRLIDNNLEVATFTLIHPSWGYPASWLMDVDARQIKNQLRTHLNRAGVTTAPGFLWAHLHGEYEPSSDGYQLHFHGVCGGSKRQALDSLRNTQGYVRSDQIFRPVVIKKVRDRARQVSYVMQGFWPEKIRIAIGDGGAQRRVRRKRRTREPYQSLYLMWLDQWRTNDLRVLNGMGKEWL